MMSLRLAVPLAAGLLAAVPAHCAAADAKAFEGVWLIEHRTDDLRPNGEPVPFTKAGKAAYDENLRLKKAKKFDDYDITISRCSTPGVPRLMITPQRFKIHEMFGVVTFNFEWNRTIRQIDTRGIEIEPPIGTRATGVSKGHWEGDTLVAVTTELPDRTLIDQLLPHTWDLKVTEKLRLLDANTLEDRITIEDPEYYSRPWEAVVTYSRQPFALFPEQVCLDSLPARKAE